MSTWFAKKRSRSDVPRLKPRGQQQSIHKVDLGDLTPKLLPYLGQAAYLQLEAFEALSRAMASAPTLEAKAGLAVSAGLALTKHAGLTAEILRHHGDPITVMQPFAPAIRRFSEVISGGDWYELLLSSYLTDGLLNDFFIQLAPGLPGETGKRVVAILQQDSGTTPITSAIESGIRADSRLASSLALWGRRLVGDTLLVARSALALSGNVASDELRIEPAFTELIAAHTRRMDALGLSA